MGYTALGAEKTPVSSKARNLKYAQEAIAFIREDCEKLKFQDNAEQGKSKGKGTIPYNMERDLDRLCLENAIARFVKSGSRNDAFDVYYCYCEIFKPFGNDSETARKLLELLSDHEYNASSLLFSHRDHFSHSVYVFLLGLAIYRMHDTFKDAYKKVYEDTHLDNGQTLEHHFLQYWGLSALFHDVGYPFQIAFDQIKDYVKHLNLGNSDVFVAYEGVKKLCSVDTADMKKTRNLTGTSRLNNDAINDEDFLNAYLTKLVEEKMGGYAGNDGEKLQKTRGFGTVRDHALPSADKEKKEKEKFLDHAFFSAVILLRTFDDKMSDSFDKDVVEDCLCAITLHNSLFKYKIIKKGSPLKLQHGMPLAYLLMLCDELQCWDRVSYGQETRKKQFPIDFDLNIESKTKLSWTYFFATRDEGGNGWNKMLYLPGKEDPAGDSGIKRSKFVDDINNLVCLKDMNPDYIPDNCKDDTSNIISLKTCERAQRTGVNLSISNYLNLYTLAVALHGRYATAHDKEGLIQSFEDDLSLEYKLSNIAQAKGFAAQLHSIRCFYTDRPMELDAVERFSTTESRTIAESEHERWCKEKWEMGWRYGDSYKSREERELTRTHRDLIPYDELDETEKQKNAEAMNELLRYLEKEGLFVYRF